MLGRRGYRVLWPFLRLLPAETAHRLALFALARMRWAMPRAAQARGAAFTKAGLRFRNRIGLAAGFDKNATALRGMERLGAGFVEVGTVLVGPWPGRSERPRMLRVIPLRAVWNRLGFPSDGMDRVAERLAAWPAGRREGMLVGCNVGPHPGHVAGADAGRFAAIAGTELAALGARLSPHCDFFVVNLSSPNTPGLRDLVARPEWVEAVLAPLRKTATRPVLLKIAPEDPEGRPWSESTLAAVLAPVFEAGLCDGVVAVNTSVALARELVPESREGATGGVSGEPLRATALETVRVARRVIGSEPLLLGCGGVSGPEDVRAFLEAGADAVELYSGLVYAGPALIRECAAAG